MHSSAPSLATFTSTCMLYHPPCCTCENLTRTIQHILGLRSCMSPAQSYGACVSQSALQCRTHLAAESAKDRQEWMCAISACSTRPAIAGSNPHHSSSTALLSKAASLQDADTVTPVTTAARRQSLDHLLSPGLTSQSGVGLQPMRSAPPAAAAEVAEVSACCTFQQCHNFAGPAVLNADSSISGIPMTANPLAEVTPCEYPNDVLRHRQ